MVTVDTVVLGPVAVVSSVVGPAATDVVRATLASTSVLEMILVVALTTVSEVVAEAVEDVRVDTTADVERMDERCAQCENRH